MRIPKIVIDLVPQAIQAAPDIAQRMRDWPSEREARKKRKLFDQRWEREKLNPRPDSSAPHLFRELHPDPEWETYKAQRRLEEAPPSWPVMPLEQGTREANDAVNAPRPKPNLDPASRRGRSTPNVYDAEVRRRAELLADWANKPKRPK